MPPDGTDGPAARARAIRINALAPPFTKKKLRDFNPLPRRPPASPRPVPSRVLAQSVFMSLSSGVRPSPVVMVSLKVPPPGTMGRTCSWCGNMTSRR